MSRGKINLPPKERAKRALDRLTDSQRLELLSGYCQASLGGDENVQVLHMATFDINLISDYIESRGMSIEEFADNIRNSIVRGYRKLMSECRR